MPLESKTKLLVRHNMARLLSNDGGLGTGITEERLCAIHSQLSAGLGPNAHVDSGQFRAGGRGMKGVTEAVSEAMHMIHLDPDAQSGAVPQGTAEAGSHIIKSIAELAPFRWLNVEVGAVVAAKVLEQVGVKVGFHRILADDLSDTAKMAVRGMDARLKALIENNSKPIQPKETLFREQSNISFGKIGVKLAGMDSAIEKSPAPAGPGM